MRATLLVFPAFLLATAAPARNAGVTIDPPVVEQGSFLSVRVPGECGPGRALALGAEWPLFPGEDGLAGLVPVSLATAPGGKKLAIRLGGRKLDAGFVVSRRRPQKVQRLARLVVTAGGAENLRRNSAVFRRHFSRPSATAYWDGSGRRPAPGPVTTGFGTPRSYGGGAGWPHRGVDFGSGRGWPVVACAPGTVALARRMDEYGNTVLVDHGRTVFSSYLHLSSVSVRPGEFVGKGQVIGTVGETGMALGAHLHFGIHVAGVAVDPLEFLERGFRR